MRRVALRGLIDHKGRLVATFLAVALGVAFMGGVLTLTDTMNRAFDDLFGDVYRDTDAVVRSSETIGGSDAFSSGTRAQVDESVLAEVQDTEGVEAADGSIQSYARIIDKDGEAVGDPAFGAPTFGANWTDVDELNPFEIADGRAPEAPDEIVIDKASADSTGYQVGDSVPVQARDGVDDYTLAGIATFGTADSPGGASYVLWDTATAQRLIGESGRFNSVSVVADDGVSQQQLADDLRSSVGGDGIEVLTGQEITEETQSDIAQSLSFITSFFLVFAAIAITVGTFVIYNSFSIIVAQRTREMALLRAIGASRKQVRRAVLTEAAIVGAVGSAVGFVLGLGVATLLGSFLDRPDGGLAILPTSVATALLTGLFVTLASAFVPARRASKVPPLAAMREVAVDDSGRSRVRLVIGLLVTAVGVVGVVSGAADSEIRTVGLGIAAAFVGLLLLGPALARPVSTVLGAPLRLLGVTGSLARENVGRNPKRTSATAQALMIGVGIVAFFLVINASIRASIDKALDDGFAGDFVVDSGTFGVVGLPPDVARQIAEVPDVASATPVRFAPAVVDGDESGVAASTSDVFGLLDLDVLEGSDALGPGETVISRDKADDTGLAVGDTVDIETVDQLSGGVACAHDCTYTVAGIYDGGAGGDLGAWLIGLDDYDAAVPNATDAQVFVQLDDPSDIDRVKPEIESIVDPFVTAEVQSVDDYKDTISSTLDPILILILVLLGLSIVIAALGIANTVALSIIERTREIGLLRAVGMSRRQLRSAIRWESVIIAVFGTALGLAVGVLGGWGLVTALGEEGFNVFQVPFAWLAGLVLLAVLLGVLAALGPAWRASRRDVLQAISTE